MPILPSRSRSVRKPITQVAAASTDSSTTSTATVDQTIYGASKSERNNDLSPSRLPVKPTRSSSRKHSSKESSLQPHLPRNYKSTTTTNSNTSVLELQRSISSRQSQNTLTVEHEPIKKDRSRPPVATASRNLRPTSSNSSSTRARDSSKGRERSSSTLPSSSYSRPPTRNSVSSDVADRAPNYMLDKLAPKKPVFSIHQQHYSPAKNIAPKLHPAAFLAPPTPSKWPSNKVISTEITKLQNELLQLHILHRDSGRTEKEWRASAKNKLEVKFKKIVELENNLLELEKCENSKLNSKALEEWLEVGTPGWGIDEKIHIFDNVLTGLVSTIDAGGRYSCTIQRFEIWVDAYEKLISQREKKDGNSEEISLVVELDSAWKDDCFYLGRKLELWKDNMRDLGIPQSESPLELVLDQIQRIILAMLAEIDFMIRLEKEIMRREEHWIKLINDEMLDNLRNDEVPEVGAIWRSEEVIKNS